MQCLQARRVWRSVGHGMLMQRPATPGWHIFQPPLTGMQSFATFQLGKTAERVKATRVLQKEASPLDKSKFTSLVRQREFSELIIMVKAYLMSGHLDQAESLLEQIRTARSADWQAFEMGEQQAEACGLLNMFVQACLEAGQPDRAQEHIRAQTRHKNSLTYALLLRYHLDRDDENRCRAVLREMRAGGLLLGGSIWGHLHKTRVLERAQLDRLVPILHSLDAVNGSGGEISMPLMELQAEDEGVVEVVPSAPAREISAPLDEVRSVESNSHGIDFIKQALSSLKAAYESGTKSSVDVYRLQERLERDCSDAATEQFRAALGQFLDLSQAPNVTRVRALLSEWHGQLTAHLQGLVGRMTAEPEEGTGGRVLYAALLSSLPAEKIAIIALQELTRIAAIDTTLDGTPVARIATNIGSCLEREIFAQQIGRKEFLSYVRLSPKQRTQLLHNRRAFNRLMERMRHNLDDSIEARQAGWIPAWSVTLKAEVGTFVAHEAVRILRYRPSSQLLPEPTDEPAFSHELVTRDRKRFGIIRMHHALYEALSSEPEFFSIDPTAMPMIVPPNPWLSYNQGGYLTQKLICVRLKEDPVHLSVLHGANANGKMEAVLQGLDILGQTAWRINEPVLRIAIALWNTGINVATLEAPPPVKTFEYRAPETFPSHDEYRQYIASRAAHLQEKGKAHSTMCDTNYKLEIARQFCGVPFYLPHSVDFRGRAYPIPPHLSHIGSDLSRSLLVFAEGRPLGARGVFWLKVQLANMFGYDKYSLEERAAFAEKHLKEIRDSARKPLDGQQWWRTADEPWQCLAACMELDAALSSPDPEAFVSSFPVQQDGSCNGLQHYAALGRDVGGAAKVNLSPSERPQDIYGAVANLVSERIEADCQRGDVPMALKLRGKINRKIIKQPVMTNVYGVTPFGARAQIQERLKEYNVVPAEDYQVARKYLCDLVFSSLHSLFDKARLIQDWLTTVAEEISRSVPREVATTAFGMRPDTLVTTISGERYRTPVASRSDSTEMENLLQRYPQTAVSWDTPLGFRVVQPYLKSRCVHLKTVIQTLSLKTANRLDPVDVGKQVSAFPPNFVHSLDATHMFMTAQACFEAGVTFASVHDCFWTHASTVDDMNSHIRQQFVSLYAQPVLERLREDLVRTYGQYVVPVRIPAEKSTALPSDTVSDEGQPGSYVPRWRPINIPPMPAQGDFDITQVLKSQYFFS